MFNLDEYRRMNSGQMVAAFLFESFIGFLVIRILVAGIGWASELIGKAWAAVH